MTRHEFGTAIRERAGTARAFVASRPDWALERFAKMPMTNFLYLLVGYLWVRTCEHYMRTPGWTPSPEWLLGLGAILTGAITQWVKKRVTDHEYQRIQREAGRPSAVDPDEDGERSGRNVRPTPGDAEPSPPHT